MNVIVNFDLLKPKQSNIYTSYRSKVFFWLDNHHRALFPTKNILYFNKTLPISPFLHLNSTGPGLLFSWYLFH